MQTALVSIDSQHPELEKILRASEIIQSGGLVAFPTETVYGLGANALDENAVRAIFDAKGRPASNPLIVHVASLDAAKTLCAEWPDNAQKLAERFWPGPLTLVLPKVADVPDLVTAGGSTVALRLPAHPVALALLKSANVPLAAPSANRSTRLSPTRAKHVLRDLGGRIAMILDGGPTAGGLESTVLDITTSPPTLLRPGLVSAGEIESVIGPVSWLRKSKAGPARSPGLQEKHYAPRTPLECVEDGRNRVEELTRQGLKVGYLSLGRAALAGGSRLNVVMPDDPDQYATMLYATLHELDDAGVDRIVVDLPPDREEWRAVRDRLLRAASQVM